MPLVVLASLAFAQDLPWACPPVTVPADATVYRDTDAGLVSVYDALHDLAEVYEASAECVWVTTTTSGYDTETTEEVCETTEFTVVRTVEEYLYYDTGRSEIVTTTLQITVAAGETWTSLELTEVETSYSDSLASSGDTRWTGAWTGSVPDAPDDGWFEVAEGSSWSRESTGRERSVDTSGCAFAWSETNINYGTEEWVRAPDHLVVVTDGSAWCADGWSATIASLDGVQYGAVDATTWVRDPGDVDGDGYSAPDDCDDADPDRGPCVTDIANDGIDQDCDGADRVDFDFDNDGVDGTGFGGTDCDDAQARTFPGASDTPGDGIDEDCDGADDIDADGDGATADGDDQAADCDDTDARRAPAFDDEPYDGVDQDCTGADLTDVDRDGYDAEEVGGTDCDDERARIHPDADDPLCDDVDQDCDGDPGACDDTGSAAPDPDPDPDPASPDEPRAECGGTGCATGPAAWLLLLPLLGRRRQR
ncbi:MAG: MopE-related protein [Pseudomonadota bacterium]|nr:MopE-related protein [Pseudomonadota bacterium]